MFPVPVGRCTDFSAGPPAPGVEMEAGHDWDQAYLEFRNARDRYVERARASLGVTGAVARDVARPAAWRPAAGSSSAP